MSCENCNSKSAIDPEYYRGKSSKIGVDGLDSTIKEYGNTIESLRLMIKEKEAYLSELRKVRKLITPEMEASIKALKGVNLL